MAAIVSIQKKSLYSFYYPGFNFRPTDLGAFLGLRQLEKMKNMISSRQRNYHVYENALKEKYWVQKSDYDLLASFAFGTYVKNRLDTYRALISEGIESRPLVCGNIGKQPFWVKKFGEADLPNANLVHTNGLYLPNHQNLNKEEVEFVAEKLCAIGEPLRI